jgi:hypothetical protein
MPRSRPIHRIPTRYSALISEHREETITFVNHRDNEDVLHDRFEATHTVKPQCVQPTRESLRRPPLRQCEDPDSRLSPPQWAECVRGRVLRYAHAPSANDQFEPLVEAHDQPTQNREIELRETSSARKRSMQPALRSA